MQRAVAGTGAALLLSLAQATQQGTNGPVLLPAYAVERDEGKVIVKAPKWKWSTNNLMETC